LGAAMLMAAQVASVVPAATQVLLTVLHLGRAVSMAAQEESLLPTATHVLGVAVEHTSEAAELPPLVPSQSVEAAHATQADPTYLGAAMLMAAQVASLLPTATHVLGDAVEHTSVDAELSPLVPSQSLESRHATQAFPLTSHLGAAMSMAAQVTSLFPAGTHVLGDAVEHTSAPLLPVQWASVTHSTQALPLHSGVALVVAAVQLTQADPKYLGVAVSMAAQVPSLLPTGTHVLGVAVEHTSVPLLPVQWASVTHATKVPAVVASAPALQAFAAL
jgi:hypothetical protein